MPINIELFDLTRDFVATLATELDNYKVAETNWSHRSREAFGQYGFLGTDLLRLTVESIREKNRVAGLDAMHQELFSQAARRFRQAHTDMTAHVYGDVGGPITSHVLTLMTCRVKDTIVLPILRGLIPVKATPRDRLRLEDLEEMERRGIELSSEDTSTPALKGPASRPVFTVIQGGKKEPPKYTPGTD